MLADQQAKALVSSGQIQDTDVMSTVESYKRRSNSYFRNPLMPPKEVFVNIPEAHKPAINRTPLYKQQKDLIINGVGEMNRGVPRHTAKETLMGHHSLDLKGKILGQLTRENLVDVQKRISKEGDERRQEILDENVA